MVFNIRIIKNAPIYKIPCKDCKDYYIGQTCRPIIKRINEHEACYRLNNYIDSIGNIKSAPAKHSYEMDHTIDWNNTTILTVAQNRTQNIFLFLLIRLQRYLKIAKNHSAYHNRYYPRNDYYMIDSNSDVLCLNLCLTLIYILVINR